MATGFVRIVSPSVVLLVFFWGLGTTPDAPEVGKGRVSGGVSLEESRALAE